MSSNIFKSNLSDLQKVKVGQKGGKPSPGSGGDYHVIPDDQGGDDQDSEDQQDGQDQNGQDGQGQGPPANMDIGGNPNPIVDVIPEDSSLSDMFGDAEELQGSDTKSGSGMTRDAKKDALTKAEEAESKEGAGEGSKGVGKGMGGRRVALAGDFPVKTDWAGILVNLLNTKRPGPPSWSKIHKKTFGTKIGGRPVMRPGRTDKPDVGKIVIAIDTSGSIDDVIMNRFISELRRIYSVFQSSKTFATKIILWSDGPYAQSPEFPSNKFNELKNWINTNTKSGGTAINQVVQLINGFPDLNEYIATVWFTDGEIWDLRTPLPDMDNVFVIQGFSSDTSKRFFADVQKYRPRNKKITIVRTDY